MKIKFSIILFAIVLLSCYSKKDAKQQGIDSEIVQILKDFVTKSDTTYTLKYDDSVFHLDTLINECSVNNNIHTALVYILNSECSICLGSLFDFLFHFQEIKETIPIIVIAEVGNKEILKYYIEQSQMTIVDLKYIENIDNKYVEGRLESYNGTIFYMYNDKIINSLSLNSTLLK
jgi:hypothetical protein